MSSKSNDQGRAYEFICLLSLEEAIKAIRPVQIIKNSSYDAAERAWNTLSAADQKLYQLSAASTIQTIFDLEPNIIEKDDDVLNLYIQIDQRGEDADVRDIIIERKDIVWEIGLSIKHNHLAVKHSRLAKHLDFGQKWYDVPCSSTYWNDIKGVFEYLDKEQAKGSYFRDLPAKEDDVYLPLLKAFLNEVKRAIQIDSKVPRNMVEYLLSKYDFYKVISLDERRVTTIQSFNMYGTLNKASKTLKPAIKVPAMLLPTTLLYADMKPYSKTTVLLCFDNGWQFSFRLHNAKDIVESSLKFDVQIVGLPAEVNIKYNCKW